MVLPQTGTLYSSEYSLFIQTWTISIFLSLKFEFLLQKLHSAHVMFKTCFKYQRYGTVVGAKLMVILITHVIQHYFRSTTEFLEEVVVKMC